MEPGVKAMKRKADEVHYLLDVSTGTYLNCYGGTRELVSSPPAI